MGADAVVIYYGVRDTVTNDDEEQIEMLETRQHWTQQSARNARLNHWWGLLTDGSDYHILLGKEVGIFGLEGDYHKSIDLTTLHQMKEEVQAAFQELGIKESPSLHIQLEADY